MSKKFIPNGDTDFVLKAENFARHIAEDPAKFEIAQEDSDALNVAVQQFRVAFQASRKSARSEATTRAKNDARAEAVRIMRRLGHRVRSNDRLDAATKMTLGIQPRVEKPKVLTVPNESPRLRFVRALHEGNGATPVHELKFYSAAGITGPTKPPGAERLELFVDLISPDEPIPSHPGANHASRPWYLRSYTRSPIKIAPPMARVPMRVLYWGRWADKQGNVGPFSATAVAWIEGGSHAHLPGSAQPVLGKSPVKLFEDPANADPNGRDASISVAVLEVRYASMLQSPIVESLPSPVMRDVKQIESPEASEAA